MFSGIICGISLCAEVVHALVTPRFRGGKLLQQSDLRPVPRLSNRDFPYGFVTMPPTVLVALFEAIIAHLHAARLRDPCFQSLL